MKRLVILITFILISLNSKAQKIDHTLWSSFLQKHVTANGNVNYKSIKANEADLNTYLNQFVKISPQESWAKNETLAYWINAYNAFTIKLIIDNYPVNSIKDIKNPWDKKFIPVDGKMISLNFIEHSILRKMNEPRIHFAINCASVSCPKLLNKAYLPETLDSQLDVATTTFISSENNSIKQDKLALSKIFKWFAEDFKKEGSLIDFLNNYSKTKINSNPKIVYFGYNWDLNE